MGSSPQVRFINPDTLNRNPAFSNVVVVSGPARTIYVSGQNAVDRTGNVVGKGDISAQTEQVLANIQAALEAADAELHHIVKWNMFIVEGQDLRAGFQAFQKFWGNRPNPPAISSCFVSALANPDFLLEMDAIAVIPV